FPSARTDGRRPDYVLIRPAAGKPAWPRGAAGVRASRDERVRRQCASCCHGRPAVCVQFGGGGDLLFRTERLRARPRVGARRHIRDLPDTAAVPVAPALRGRTAVHLRLRAALPYRSDTVRPDARLPTHVLAAADL